MFYLDGVYIGRSSRQPVRFRRVKAPNTDELTRLTHTIARLFDRGHGSIQRILLEKGGIRPLPSSRSRLSLTLAEREEISRGQVTGYSIRSIAMSLGRAPSTVSREVNRNGGRGEDPVVIQKILAHLDDNTTSAATALLPDCRASPAVACASEKLLIILTHCSQPASSMGFLAQSLCICGKQISK